MSGVRTIQCDAMLLGWSETHNGGAKVTLQLADIADLEPFKRMTIKKGKVAGQLLTAVFVEVDGNGEPVPQEPEAGTGKQKKGASKFPGGYCGLAVRWCGEITFQRWLEDNFPQVATECTSTIANYETIDINTFCAWCVKKICGVSSRKELDTDDMARAIFNNQIRQPYSQHRKELGLE